MSYLRYTYFVFICSLVSFNASALSLADVNHEVNIAVADIQLLKDHYAKDSVTRVPGIQIGKTTVHAYTKSLELLEKIQKFQKQHNLPQLELPPFPKKRVKSKHLMTVSELVKSEIKKITTPLKLDAKEIKKQDKSKTSSDIYEGIWLGSYLMDALIESIKPEDVLRNTNMIETGLIDIAKRRNKKIVFPVLKEFTDKKPVDVTLQLYKLLYKVAELELKLKVKPLLVPAFPAGKVLPEDAYEASSNVIADLTRIAIKLKIPPVTRIDTTSSKITPNEIYAKVVRLNAGIEVLIK